MLKVIQEKGRITPKDLVRETSLPKRTVAHALKKLKEKHLILERFDLNDMRQRYYLASVIEEFPINFT
ncbi:MAG: winged helix-turn-helix domain-containing protein [archaeon]|nr:winged helix-turn-helix domain-containing protein [archaeon]